jgi:Fur family zinc uptake transcriptional regulator
MTKAPEAHVFAKHNHAHCADDAMARAEMLAEKAGAKLTAVRRRVLEILLESHRAIGAYEMLDRLAAEGFGRQPPVAYRALDFLVEHGLAHRIQRLNAFAACHHAGAAHEPAFLICRACGLLAEAPGLGARRALDLQAAKAGFTVERASIEALGLCPACKDAVA